MSWPRTLYDYRQGGRLILHISDEERALMRVSDDWLRCVAFVCAQENDGSTLFGGTAFFVSVPLVENPARLFVYTVTARHVIERAAQYPRMFIRLNTPAGTTLDANMTSSVWHFPDNPASDVAVVQWAPPNGVADYTTIPADMFATPEVIQREAIGIGDDLAIIGLFTRVTGTQRNRPITRMGHIAAVADEPLIDDDTGREFRAHLAEIRSIGGLSGSPVFVLLEPGRETPGRGITLARKGFLLGMIRGHWDITRQPVPLDFGNEDADKVNVGIATVTPMADILDVINGEEYAKARRDFDRKLTKELAASKD